MWDLPISVTVDNKIYHITNKCDYRICLDVASIWQDNELDDQGKVICSLILFYEELTRENIWECSEKELKTLQEEMFLIINNGEKQETNEKKPKLMDWEYDFPIIAPPIGHILGYDIRNQEKYTHWFTFLGAYSEVSDCTFSTVISIRSKKAKGLKLEKHELDFIREHRNLIELPQKLTDEEQKYLDSDW